MGTVATFRRARPDVLAAAASDPERVRKLLFGDLPATRRYEPGGILGFVLRFLPVTVEEVDPAAPIGPPDPDVLEIEVWQPLHVHFTDAHGERERAWPQSFLTSGGQELDDDALDSPPRLLSSDHVAEIDAFLRRRETEIYSGRHAADFTDLCAFVREAARRGDGLLVHVG